MYVTISMISSTEIWLFLFLMYYFVKVLSNVEYNLFSKICFFENFWLSQLDQPNFNYPLLRKITKIYLGCICSWIGPSILERTHPQSKEPIWKCPNFLLRQTSSKNMKPYQQVRLWRLMYPFALMMRIAFNMRSTNVWLQSWMFSVQLQ